MVVLLHRQGVLVGLVIWVLVKWTLLTTPPQYLVSLVPREQRQRHGHEQWHHRRSRQQQREHHCLLFGPTKARVQWMLSLPPRREPDPHLPRSERGPEGNWE